MEGETPTNNNRDSLSEWICDSKNYIQNEGQNDGLRIVTLVI